VTHKSGIAVDGQYITGQYIASSITTSSSQSELSFLTENELS